MTLTELIVVFVIVAIVFGITIPRFAPLLGGVRDNAARDQLLGVQVDARRVAALPGNHYRYPEDLADQLNLPDLTVVDAAESTDTETVSVDRRSSTVALFAVRSAEDACLILGDDVDSDAGGWAIVLDALSCNAADFTLAQTTGSREEPNLLPL